MGRMSKVNVEGLVKFLLKKRTEKINEVIVEVIETIPSSKEFFDTLIPACKVVVIPKNTLSILNRLKDE